MSWKIGLHIALAIASSASAADLNDKAVVLAARLHQIEDLQADRLREGAATFTKAMDALKETTSELGGKSPWYRKFIVMHSLVSGFEKWSKERASYAIQREELANTVRFLGRTFALEFQWIEVRRQAIELLAPNQSNALLPKVKERLEEALSEMHKNEILTRLGYSYQYADERFRLEVWGERQRQKIEVLKADIKERSEKKMKESFKAALPVLAGGLVGSLLYLSNPLELLASVAGTAILGGMTTAMDYQIKGKFQKRKTQELSTVQKLLSELPELYDQEFFSAFRKEIGGTGFEEWGKTPQELRQLITMFYDEAKKGAVFQQCSDLL